MDGIIATTCLVAVEFLLAVDATRMATPDRFPEKKILENWVDRANFALAEPSRQLKSCILIRIDRNSLCSLWLPEGQQW